MKSFRFLILFLIISLSLFLIGVGIAQITKVYLSNVSAPSFRTLTIVFTGGGTGQVSVTPPDSTITSTFSFDYPLNTTVTISGTATGGSTFVGWEGAGCSGTSPCNIVMSENKTVYANFWGPPLGDYLIGWYRFNEGSGSTVYNVATNGSLGGGLLPNLNVVFNKNTFWTYLPGFGSVPEIGSGLQVADFAYATPNRTIGGSSGSSIGIFIKPKATGYPNQDSIGFYASCKQQNNINVSDVGYQIDYYYQFEANKHYFDAVYSGTTKSKQLSASEIRGRWFFHFINNYGQHYIVRPEGDIILLDSFSITVPLNFHYMFAGCRYSTSTFSQPFDTAGGSFGDWLIYSNTMLTNAQWGQIYDNLRSRYGMALRSGW